MGRGKSDNLDTGIALVDGANARMNDLAQDLRPPLIDGFGLDASLRWYLEREAHRPGSRVCNSRCATTAKAST